jgi:hypothetical protein
LSLLLLLLLLLLHCALLLRLLLPPPLLLLLLLLLLNIAECSCFQTASCVRGHLLCMAQHPFCCCCCCCGSVLTDDFLRVLGSNGSIWAFRCLSLSHCFYLLPLLLLLLLLLL